MRKIDETGKTRAFSVSNAQLAEARDTSERQQQRLRELEEQSRVPGGRLRLLSSSSCAPGRC